MQAGLGGSVIDEQYSESLPDLDDPREDQRVVIEFGEGCNRHDLGDSTEAEHFLGLQLVHVVQTLRDAQEGIGYHMV